MHAFRAGLWLILLFGTTVPHLCPAQDTRLVRDTEALSPEEEWTRLAVPEGFTISLFAAEPLINKPINLAFDPRGRLWVSSTVEYPYAASKDRWTDPEGSRVRDSRDAIKILEDTDGDGAADKVTDFADGLNIPTGVLPWHKPEHRDGCIAWSIPNLWYFADTDGDGTCDLREVLFGPLGYEKDTHGMCSSLRDGGDGWIYATHGFNNTSHLVAKDGSTLDLHSGNVFRFRPDASHVEIWSRGQVNPFGLAFDRRGNLYSADCHSAPVYQLMRGACYPSFGKPHDGLGFAPVMCGHTHGSTGICGIAYVDGGMWGPEWDDHVFIGNVVTSRINHDRVVFHGSSPEAVEEPDLVVSSDPWFRPVDLRIGPDGALYVADFYNRIIGHYEVPLDHPGRDRERGRIWRITREGAQAPIAQAPPVPTPRPPEDWITALREGNPFAKREAAAALLDRPAPSTLGPLLEALRAVPEEDNHLRHALRLALRAVLSQPGLLTREEVDGDPEVASLALAIPTAEASAYLARQSPASAADGNARLIHIARYADTSTDLLDRAIASRRTALAGNASGQWAAIESARDGLSEAGRPLTSALMDWAVQLAKELLAAKAPRPPTVWEPLPESGPSPWVVQERPGPDGAPTQVLSSLNKGQPGAEQRTGTLRSAVFPAPSRLGFALCGHRGPTAAPPHEKNLVRLVQESDGKVLASAQPPRQDACVLIEWDLTGVAGQPVRFEIIDGDDGSAYAWLAVGQFTTPVLDVSTFAAEDTNHRLLTSLAGLLQHTAPAALREALAPYLPAQRAPPPPPVSPADRARLEALIQDRLASFTTASPDPVRGKTLFTVHCSTCHQIAGTGGLVGPQLDGIGNRGAARLCEDILDPNRNVDTHFQVHTVTLKSGGTQSGLERGEIGKLLLLVDASGTEHKVPLADIAKDEALALSPMSPAFGQLLTAGEFHDLLAFLLQAR